jgi:hypothetical protein
MVRLTHDVLDSQLMDREGRPCGKVDGIVLVVGEHGTPPRVVALEVGALTLARRLHPRLARWLMRWGGRLGPAAPHAFRIPWSQVRALSRKEIRVDIDAAATPLWSLERWLAERVIARLPGGS